MMSTTLLTILAMNPDEHTRYGEISLLIFFGIFVLVLIYTFRRRNQAMFARAARLPLEDDHSGPRPEGEDSDADR